MAGPYIETTYGLYLSNSLPLAKSLIAIVTATPILQAQKVAEVTGVEPATPHGATAFEAAS